jgi:hypothetical protein
MKVVWSPLALQKLGDAGLFSETLCVRHSRHKLRRIR